MNAKENNMKTLLYVGISIFVTAGVFSFIGLMYYLIERPFRPNYVPSSEYVVETIYDRLNKNGRGSEISVDKME